MSKHSTLDQLKMLALRTKGEINKVDTRVTGCLAGSMNLSLRAAS